MSGCMCSRCFNEAVYFFPKEQNLYLCEECFNKVKKDESLKDELESCFDVENKDTDTKHAH